MTLDDRDGGFTLVELLMAVVITGIITATLGAAMIVGLRTSGATAVRLNESHDAQLLSTYLVADMVSVAESGVTVPAGSASACPAVASESAYTSVTNVVRLTWNQPLPVSTDYTAEYRRAYSTATQQWQLLRKTCGGGPTQLLVVVHDLSPAVAPAVDTTRPAVVALTVTEPSQYAYTVAGTRRTPDASPVPVPPWSCTVLSAVGTPDPATRATVAPGPLTQDEKIVVQTGGACSALKITVTPGETTSASVPLGESPAGSGRYVTTLAKGAYTWTDGIKDFPITSGASTLATLRLTVKQACIPSAVTASPATVRRVEGAAPGQLSSDVTVDVTTSGVCLPLVVTYDDRPGSTGSAPLTETSPGAWTATIPAGATTWSDGLHSLRVEESGVPVTLATTTLTVTPSCVVTPGTATATPPAVGRTGPGKAQLESDVQVALQTTGRCAGLEVRFVPGDAGSPEVRAAVTETTAGAWNGTVAATAGAWTKGTKSLAFFDTYGNRLGSVDLEVLA